MAPPRPCRPTRATRMLWCHNKTSNYHGAVAALGHPVPTKIGWLVAGVTVPPVVAVVMMLLLPGGESHPWILSREDF